MAWFEGGEAARDFSSARPDPTAHAARLPPLRFRVGRVGCGRIESHLNGSLFETGMEDTLDSPSHGASSAAERVRHHSDNLRNRRAFPITETELKLMAAPAIIGFRRSPRKG